jgi:hypothetical protein
MDKTIPSRNPDMAEESGTLKFGFLTSGVPAPHLKL